MCALDLWRSAVVSNNGCEPASSAVIRAERLAEGDLVSLGVGDFCFAVAPRLGFNRSNDNSAFLQYSDAAIEVVHHEGEQGLPSVLGIGDDIDPCVLEYLPHRFVFVWIDIPWSPDQAFVPRACR